MPPVPIMRGGLRVSNETSASRCLSTTSSMMSGSLAVDFGPERAAHAEQLDETLGLDHAPVGRLRVDGALGIEDVRGVDRDRIDHAAVGFQHDLAVDHRLARREERFQVGLERIVEETLVDQLDPLARDLGLEAVLLL